MNDDEWDNDKTIYINTPPPPPKSPTIVLNRNTIGNMKDIEDIAEVATNSDVEYTDKEALKDAQMWASFNGRFTACERAVVQLEPGQYNIGATDSGIVFTKHTVNTDKLFVLPDSASDEIIQGIEMFWEKEEHFRRLNFLWKRGIMLYGPPGSGKCLGKGTPILMYDGTVKCVEDVVVGDLLMGDDSTSRLVLSLARGQEMMYNVKQKKGDDYIVNESHILSLKRTTIKKDKNKTKSTEFVDIAVRNYLTSSNNFKKEYFGYKVAVEYNTTDVDIDPYFIGLWLGDGTSSKPDITTADDTIVKYLYEIADSVGLSINKYISEHMGKASTYSFTSGYSKCPVPGANPIRNILRKYNLFNNKHIPQSFLINDTNNRLQLLAGLLDSDGYLGSNCFEFSNTNTQLIQDVVVLARSLGFHCSVSDKKTICNGKTFASQSIHISGHTDIIPTKLTRKQATPRRQIKNPLHTTIALEQLGIDDYYGFEIDGNKRFLLGDCTVTHNTSTVQQISQRIVDRGGIAFYVDNPSLGAAGLELFRRIEPDRPVLVILEDIDAIICNNGESSLLSLLDGELQIDNVVFIATTNYPERLDKRIINRPSRFDVIKLIGMPSEEARSMYLTNISVILQKDVRKLREWVTLTTGYSIAHLKELLVSVEVFELPLHDTIARLNKMIDVQVSSEHDEKRKEFGFYD